MYARSKFSKKNPIMPRYRRYSSYSKRPSVNKMATYAWKGVKSIRSLINVERKYHDVSASTTPNSSGTIINLSNIAQGNDYNNRDGNSILLQSHLMRFDMGNNASALQTFIRCIIFSDNDQRGADPAVTDVLESAGTNSPLNHFVNKRFTIYRDFKVNLETNNQTACKKLFYRFPTPTHCKYQSTAGADASNYEGAMYMLLISDQGTNTPTINWHSRLRFTDN